MKYIWSRVSSLSMLLATVVALVGTTAEQAEAATLLKGSFRGDAYGTYANAKAGKVATTLGRSAYIPCPCNGTGGAVRSNTVTTVDAGDALKAQKLYSTVNTNKTATSAQVRNTSKVTGLSALDGLITADAVLAVANTSANASAITSSPDGSGFVDLKINGVTYTSVAQNSQVSLPGLGYVRLREVSRSGDGVSSGAITVNMLRIVITQENSLGLAVGSQMTVAHTRSGYSRQQPPTLVGGHAFAAAANSTAVVANRIGRAAAIYLGCAGTGGQTRTNNIYSLSVPGVLVSGTGSSTAFGGPVSTGTKAETTSAVQNLNLLSGLITADRVKAVATSRYGSGTGYSSTSGSGFTDLRVAGLSLGSSVAPNTEINLPGIGYVRLYERSTSGGATGARTSVTMVRVVVNQSNLLGLPVGTHIVVAQAASRALPFE